MKRGIRRNGGIPGFGCERDTDGDGNCPIHPYGCLMATVEQEQLAALQESDEHKETPDA